MITVVNRKFTSKFLKTFLKIASFWLELITSNIKLTMTSHSYKENKTVFLLGDKFRNKPWINLGLKKSVSIKNHLLTKYIKLKYVTLKNEAQIKYKQYRNLLSTLMKESIYYILFHKLFPKQPK